MSTHSLSLLPISCHRKPNDSASSLLLSVRPNGLFSSLTGQKLSVRPSHSRLVVSTRCGSTVATVLFSLPTAKPERTPPEKVPKWSSRAIKAFTMAELEARKLKYPNTGTEALLMGILVEGTSLAARFLRANGITLFKVREETVNLLGKSDLYFFSPEHPPLTEPAQRALDWAVDEKLKSGEEGEITTSHLLLGIWAQAESAGHKIMASLGFDDDKAKELAESSLQKKLVDSVHHAAGLNPRSFRQFCSSCKAHRPGPDNIVDCELLCQYEMVPFEEKLAIAQQIGTTHTQILSNLDGLSLGTSFL